MSRGLKSKINHGGGGGERREMHHSLVLNVIMLMIYLLITMPLKYLLLQKLWFGINPLIVADLDTTGEDPKTS